MLALNKPSHECIDAENDLQNRFLHSEPGETLQMPAVVQGEEVSSVFPCLP